MPITDTRPASQRQLEYARTLWRDRDANALTGLTAETVYDLAGGKFVSMSEVSRLIDGLKKCPRRPTAAVTQPQAEAFDSDTLTVGIYELPDGAIYAVKRSQGKHMYAKRMVRIPSTRLSEAGTAIEIEYEYERGAVKRIRPEHKLTPERAEELSLRYGRCIICGRVLKVAQSVSRGIGPVCWKNQGLA